MVLCFFSSRLQPIIPMVVDDYVTGRLFIFSLPFGSVGVEPDPPERKKGLLPEWRDGFHAVRWPKTDQRKRPCGVWLRGRSAGGGSMWGLLHAN